MIKHLLTLFILAFALKASAQQESKISIFYDDNGNRILRQKNAYPRPAPPQDSTGSEVKDVLALKADSVGLLGITLYPNPTTGPVTLSISDKEMLKHESWFVVADARGREMFRERITALVSHYDLHLSADGVYFCTVIRGDKKQTFRVVKKTK